MVKRARRRGYWGSAFVACRAGWYIRCMPRVYCPGYEDAKAKISVSIISCESSSQSWVEYSRLPCSRCLQAIYRRARRLEFEAFHARPRGSWPDGRQERVGAEDKQGGLTRPRRRQSLFSSRMRLSRAVRPLHHASLAYSSGQSQGAKRPLALISSSREIVLTWLLRGRTGQGAEVVARLGGSHLSGK